MSDLDDIFRVMEERQPGAPQVRIYLVTIGSPPVASLSAALPDYEAVVPRSRTEIAFIRKMAVESEEQLRLKVQRVATIVAPLMVADSRLSGVYDNSKGRTQFLVELRKIGANPQFIEIEHPPDLER